MPSIERMICDKFAIDLRSGIPLCSRRGTRVTLAELFGEAHYNNGAEIGVQAGIYSEVLCKANPNLKLLCVDSWAPYRDFPRKSRQDAMFLETMNRLANYPGATIKRMTSIEASRDVPNGSLDFVYIDAAHDFDSVMMDLIHWVPKVRRRGIVAGHDYCYMRFCSVIGAVNAYRESRGIGTWYVTDDPGVRDLSRQLGRMPSWFWVQP